MDPITRKLTGDADDPRPGIRRNVHTRAVIGAAHLAAEHTADAADAAHDAAVGAGGQALAGAAAVALERLSVSLRGVAAQFAAMSDAARDIHLDDLGRRLGDLPDDYLDDVLDRRPPDPDDHAASPHHHGVSSEYHERVTSPTDGRPYPGTSAQPDSGIYLG